jgi:hypothetical protein
MWLPIVRHESDMGTTQYNRNSTLTEVPGKLIRPLGVAGDDGDANQINVEINGDIFDAFIEN